MNTFRRLFQKLDDLKETPPLAGWDSYIAPNSIARRHAKALLKRLQKLDCNPQDLSPSAEGGIVLFFRKGDRYVDFECFHDGDILVGMHSATESPRVWAITLEQTHEAVKIIRGFLMQELENRR